MKYLYLICLFVLVSFSMGYSQVTLSPGDIMVVGMNADAPDDFAIVPFVDLPAGTKIHITDQGWSNSNNSFTGTGPFENSVTYTVPAGGIPAGTVLTGDTDLGLNLNSINSAFGDQLHIYQTANGSASSTPTLIYGFNNNNFYTGFTDQGWQTDITNIQPTSQTSSYAASALTKVTTSGGTGTAFGLLSVSGENDNVIYSGPTTETDVETWITRIHTVSNWSGNNTSAYDFDTELPLILPLISPSSDPEADVRNSSDNADIADGSTTISTALGTDFGNVGAVSSNASKTFRLENNGLGVLNLGADALAISNTTDFSITTDLTNNGTIAASSVSTFTIQFDPASVGTKTATVTIRSDDSDEDPYTFNIQGVGTDNTAPTATITLDDSALTVGETATVTITFSEAVTGFANADLSIPNGTMTGVSSADGGITFTATYTPTADIEDATNVIILANTGVMDVAGNAGTGTTDSPNFTIDTKRPTASITMSDDALKAGETATVTITFSEAVTGFANADLSIPNGTMTAVSSANGGITFTAIFTPTVNIEDATNLISLDNSGVADAAGNSGTGTTDSPNFTIDTKRPTASITMSDAALTRGETATVTITFSEAITGFSNADLSIPNGTLTAVSSANGGITFTATFTPTVDIADATNLITLDNAGIADAAGNEGTGTTDSPNFTINTKLISAAITMSDDALKAGETAIVTITFSEAATGFANADLSIPNGTLTTVSSADGGITFTATFTPSADIEDATNVITLDNTGVTNSGGNAGTGTTDSPNFTIDTKRPTANITMSDDALKAGETATVTITFSEAVTGFSNADLSIPNGTMTAVSSADGGVTFTATYTPTADIEDATNVITLDNTGMADAAGNAGTGTTDSPNFTIDTKQPTASITMSDAALKAGETATVTITFSEAVTGFTNVDLSIPNGTMTAVSSANGGITFTATFTPSVNIEDATNVISLDNSGVADAAGNSGTGTTDSPNFTIDTKRPTASITMSDAALTRGETATVTITFSEAITGFSNADLSIPNGTLTAVSSANGGITFTATFTPTADIVDATNVISLDNAGITDAAGNEGTGTTDSPNFTIDTKLISAAITMSDDALKAGETAIVTITFSEAATGFANADLSIPNGTMTTVSSADGGITFTATFTPSADIEDATNVITLDNTGVTNSGGNAGTGTTDSPNFTIDTTRPTANITMSDDALKAGETAIVTITFSEAVTGFVNADLSIPNGTMTAVNSANGGVTFTATYTPSLNIEDATNLISLDNSGVADAAGNAGTGTTDSPNFTIDTKRPTANITMSDDALKAGETAIVTITFSEAVTGFVNADLSIPNGTMTAVNSANGGVTFTATYTPSLNIEDATNLISLDNSGVADAAGNAGTGTTDSPNFTIDTKRPTASITMSDDALKVGETATVTITFTEAITGFANADLSIPNGTMTAVSSANGGITFTATFTPSVNIEDATNLISLDNSGVADAAGNAGTGTTDSPNFTIDTKRPTASITLSDAALTRGETATVTITFSEAVTGFTNVDLSIPNGTMTAVSSANGGITFTATFTPTADIEDATNLISLDNAGIADAAGNEGTGTTDSPNFTINTKLISAVITMSDDALKAGETAIVTITFSEAATGFANADLSIPNGTLTTVSSADGGITFTATFTPSADIEDAANVITLDNTGVTNSGGNEGTGTTDSPNFTIDTKRPTANITMSDDALKAGETAIVTITFSEAVTGFVNADLSIPNGTMTAVNSANGGVTFTATYTPSLNIEDATNLISLDNSGVADAAGNAGTGTTDSPNFTIDTKRPTANITMSDDALKAGETAIVTITFSEAVTGFANADLSIPNGTMTAVSSADGGVTFTATYTPTADIEDATNVITLDNTGVADAAGNAGTGTTDSPNFTIDTKRPTASITMSDDALKAGETATVTITFSEAVTGFTNVDLSIPNGTMTAVSSANGGITFTATYTPTADIEDATNIITLDNTGIADAAGNAGTGTTDSPNFTIDTKRPTASITMSDDALKAGETATVTITFSEAVTGFTNVDLSIPNGTLTAVSSANGGITFTATFTPTADIEDATNLISLDNAGIADAAGNEGTGTTDSPNFTINTKLISAVITMSDDALKAGETAIVTITFSEAATGFANADLSIPNGTLTTVSSADGGITFTATFTPSADIEDATNVITLDNTGVTNSGGNAGTGTTDSPNFTIDTKRPTASITMSDDALKAGETAIVTITFSEAVTGFANADLSIPNGTMTAVSSADGGIIFTATFTPSVNIEDATNLISLDNSGVADAAGNAGTGTTDSPNFTIDTKRPTASITMSDDALTRGETATVTITFTEAITGFSNTDLSIPNGTLTAVSSADGGITFTATFTPTVDIADATNLISLDNSGVADAAGNEGTGTTDSPNFTIDTKAPTASITMSDDALKVGETATVTITFTEAITGFANADLSIPNGTMTAVSSANGGITFTAIFTPTADIEDATNIITLDNTGIADAAGNAGTGTTDSPNFTIDTKRPTASITMSDAALTRGETATVTITFSEAVTGFTNVDLSIPNGTLTAVSSADGGITFTATFTPTVDIADATNLISLDNSGVADAAGNEGTGTTDSPNFTIDTKLPTVTTYLPANNATGQSTTTNLVLTFSENVMIGTGNITIHKKSDNSIVETINITNAIVSVSNNVVTINPTTTLDVDTEYYINIPNTALKDMVGNNYAGISNSTDWTFKTVARSITISAVANSPKAENATGTIDFTFTADVAPTSNLVINYTVTGTATSGTDYTALSGMVTMTTGATTATVSVDPTGDTDIEIDETVTLTLAAGTGYPIGTTNTQTGTITNDDNCPVLGALTAPTTSCAGNNFNLSIDGLASMASANNGNQDLGIQFVAFTSAPADPYTGGTALGTVAFASLTGTAPNQTATLNNIGNTLTAGSYVVYAILSPAHADANCRPNKSANITVKATPSITFTSSNNGVICSGTNVTFTATGGTTYQFFVNNVSKQNGATATYTTNALAQGDKVKVTVTDAQNCPVTSTEYTANVNSTDTDGDTVPDCRDVCPGGDDLGPDLDNDMVPDECDCDSDDANDGTVTAPDFLGQITTGLYKAGLELTADKIVNANNTVELKAGKTVFLKVGFHAKAGSDVHAYIAPCVMPSPLIENDEIVEQSFITLPSTDAIGPIDLTVAPNPFRESTMLNFRLATTEDASVALYDQTGRRLKWLLSPKTLEMGDYNIRLNKDQLQPGMYLVVLQTAQERITKKVMLVR